MKQTYPFALYDAFTAVPFGGSQAAIVAEARDLSRDMRIRIAKELGYPATCFVDAVDANSVKAQFFSTVMEQPMCGHGTVCLMTWAVEQGLLNLPKAEAREIKLCLPKGDAMVTLSRTDQGRALTMLSVKPASFRSDPIDRHRLADLLGLTSEDFHPTLPLETAVADFVHLVIPVKDLDAMQRIVPDFTGIVAYCKELGIETFAAFAAETKNVSASIHVRDFCPAVGVAESAAAGTTNAALAAYLTRHDLTKLSQTGQAHIIAEQGLEIDRPSQITSIVQLDGDRISGIKVGGLATKVSEGTLLL